MLVNDRQMLSFMSDERLDELIETLKAKAEPMLDLSKFQASGRETCFHDRHIGAADLRRAGRQQLAPAGLRRARRLQALKKILAKDGVEGTPG